jgi:hypothetical protein
MISLDMIPKDTKLVIEIPEEMVNKPIHVDIRAESDGAVSIPEPDPGKLKDVRAFLDRFQIDMTNFKFDRDEANER